MARFFQGIVSRIRKRGQKARERKDAVETASRELTKRQRIEQHWNERSAALRTVTDPQLAEILSGRGDKRTPQEYKEFIERQKNLAKKNAETAMTNLWEAEGKKRPKQ